VNIRMRRVAVAAAVALPVAVFSGQGLALGSDAGKGTPVIAHTQDVAPATSMMDVTGPPGVRAAMAGQDIRPSSAPAVPGLGRFCGALTMNPHCFP